eukprot:Skav204340  [mRNA]  locus=scaffold55:219838:223659:+ [translate_table: standard]
MGITAFYGASMEDADAVKLLKAAYDMGYRYFPGRHGDSYDLPSTLEAVDASLKRLGLDCALALELPSSGELLGAEWPGWLDGG